MANMADITTAAASDPGSPRESAPPPRGRASPSPSLPPSSPFPSPACPPTLSAARLGSARRARPASGRQKAEAGLPVCPPLGAQAGRQVPGALARAPEQAPLPRPPTRPARRAPSGRRGAQDRPPQGARGPGHPGPPAATRVCASRARVSGAPAAGFAPRGCASRGDRKSPLRLPTPRGTQPCCVSRPEKKKKNRAAPPPPVQKSVPNLGTLGFTGRMLVVALRVYGLRLLGATSGLAPVIQTSLVI